MGRTVEAKDGGQPRPTTKYMFSKVLNKLIIFEKYWMVWKVK